MSVSSISAVKYRYFSSQSSRAFVLVLGLRPAQKATNLSRTCAFFQASSSATPSILISPLVQRHSTERSNRRSSFPSAELKMPDRLTKAQVRPNDATINSAASFRHMTDPFLLRIAIFRFAHDRSKNLQAKEHGQH